jgi:hypothetical protein
MNRLPRPQFLLNASVFFLHATVCYCMACTAPVFSRLALVFLTYRELGTQYRHCRTFFESGAKHSNAKEFDLSGSSVVSSMESVASSFGAKEFTAASMAHSKQKASAVQCREQARRRAGTARRRGRKGGVRRVQCYDARETKRLRMRGKRCATQLIRGKHQPVRLAGAGLF